MQTWPDLANILGLLSNLRSVYIKHTLLYLSGILELGLKFDEKTDTSDI